MEPTTPVDVLRQELCRDLALIDDHAFLQLLKDMTEHYCHQQEALVHPNFPALRHRQDHAGMVATLMLMVPLLPLLTL